MQQKNHKRVQSTGVVLGGGAVLTRGYVHKLKVDVDPRKLLRGGGGGGGGPSGPSDPGTGAGHCQGNGGWGPVYG